ncbi:MAG: leucine--tRNA ligase [Sandaracinaceae bacterium]|nr:leucine--tRNA ligase [Sandaracinaceae bacterium]
MATSPRYNHLEIERKWQAFWERDRTFETPDILANPDRPKAYILDMFPYPSGAGLHVGHPEGYTATDIYARWLRSKGYAVLHPMGWDAFGLPAEQYAIQTGTHPAITTRRNIDVFRRQIRSLGLSYDWDREIDTTDPKYVRWTQWMFLRFFRRGLAYQAEVPVNWCPALGTVLANEEVKDGKSERGGYPVYRIPLRQWMLRITAYAERLLSDLELCDWPEGTRTMQIEWIGKSTGAELDFEVLDRSQTIKVFTTRPDTIYGATFLVLAPEHPLALAIASPNEQSRVAAYIEKAKHRSERERRENKQKTGVPTGAFAIHPLTRAHLPIWVADYVIGSYGTGAIMAVPAHDERDFEFAKAHGLPIIRVIAKDPAQKDEPVDCPFTGEGIVVNSGPYEGLPSTLFKERIVSDLEARGLGKRRTEYKLRDWVFSRQRYWGEPIPIYFPVELEDPNGDPRKGTPYRIRYDQPIPMEDDELPLLLPPLDDFRPGNDPQGPLARALDWRFFKKNGQWFSRETNTMPQWAGSCWYYLRYTDPHNDKLPFDKKLADAWLPVDLYVGGAEHAVLHLLYARFWHKVLYDEGLVSHPEPFKKLVHQGMILGEVEYTTYVDKSGRPVSRERVIERTNENGDEEWQEEGTGEPLFPKKLSPQEVLKRGQDFVLRSDPSVIIDARAHKMSKSRGNVINPDAIVQEFGADTLRVYEMFMGPLEATKPWSTESIQGARRFLERAHALGMRTPSESEPPPELLRLLHKTIRKVDEDISALRFNRAISALMQLVNALYPLPNPPRQALETFALLLHPFAPHLAEEIWERLGHQPSIQRVPWPKHDPALCEEEEIEIPIQVNGKIRGRIRISKDASQEEVLALAKAEENVRKAIEGKSILREHYVPGRIVSLVIGEEPTR